MEETAETTVSAEQAELDAILAQIEELESQKAERDAKKESEAAAAAAATTTASDASVTDTSAAVTTTEAETAKADKTDKTDKPAKPVQKETEAATEAHTEAPAPTEAHTQAATQAPTEAPTEAFTQAPAPPPTTEAPTEHQHSWEPVYETQTVCVSEAWDEQVNEEHAVMRTDGTCTECGWNIAWYRTDCITGEIFERVGSTDDLHAAAREAQNTLDQGGTVSCLHMGFVETSYGDGYRTVTTTVHHDAVYEDRQVQVGERCTTCGATR